jgi:hypothetical protein
MNLTPGLFAVLTLIAAPAVLTNASSVLALNTANRFGRVIDRSRVLGGELSRTDPTEEIHAVRKAQLERLRERALMLIRAQSAIYAALGCFVGTALVAVVGALLASAGDEVSLVIGGISLVIGTGGAGSLLYACVLLVRETRVALAGLREDLSPFGEPLPAALKAPPK